MNDVTVNDLTMQWKVYYYKYTFINTCIHFFKSQTENSAPFENREVHVDLQTDSFEGQNSMDCCGELEILEAESALFSDDDIDFHVLVAISYTDIETSHTQSGKIKVCGWIKIKTFQQFGTYLISCTCVCIDLHVLIKGRIYIHVNWILFSRLNTNYKYVHLKTTYQGPVVQTIISLIIY